MERTAKSLIKRCRIKARLSDGDGVFSDEEILNHINDQIQNRIVPFYMTFRSNYFLAHEDVAFANPLSIPSNAINQKVARVELLNDSKQTTEEVRHANPNETGFSFENDKIVFHNISPSPVRLWFYKRPPNLILEAARIFESYANHGLLILEHPQFEWEPGTYEVNRLTLDQTVYLGDVSISEFTGTDVFLNAVPNFPIVPGNSLSPKGTSPIAQIPYDATYLLVLLSCLTFNLDDSLTASLQYEIQAVEHRLQQTTTPRADDTPKVFTRKTLFNSGLWD